MFLVCFWCVCVCFSVFLMCFQCVFCCVFRKNALFRAQREENFLVYVSFSVFGFSAFQFYVFVGEPGGDLFGGTRGGLEKI